MGKLGEILGGFVMLGILFIGFRPAFDELFITMNTTKQLSTIESLIWGNIPVVMVAAAAVGGVLVLARRRSNRKEGGYTEWE